MRRGTGGTRSNRTAFLSSLGMRIIALHKVLLVRLLLLSIKDQYLTDVADTPNSGSSRSGITSLHPVHLPFKTQHLMLSKVQAILEDACFDFISKHLPSLLTNGSHDYDCGAALELNKWTPILLEHESELPTKLAGKQLAKAVSDVNKLRHAAVHRERITAREVMDLLVAAVSLSEAVGDSVRTAQLGRLLNEVGDQVRTMKHHKTFLENDLRMKMEDLRRRREALDREEKDLVEGVARKDEKHKALIGNALEKAMGKLFLEESDGPGCNNVEDGRCFCNGFIIRDDSAPDAVDPGPASNPEPEYML